MADETTCRRSSRVRRAVQYYADAEAELTPLASLGEHPSQATKAYANLEDNEAYHDEHSGTFASEGATQKRAKPKSKSKRSKTKTDSLQGEQRLVITGDIVRPPGEQRPPLVWAVPKKKRDPNAPSVLSIKVANLDRDRQRARAKITRLEPGEEEFRLKEIVKSPPDSYNTFLERATTQRMFVLERTSHVEEDCHANHVDCPYEEVQIAGTSGNVYGVTVSHLPTCTCPEAIFRKSTCKHILYVLHFVLKAPGQLRYQNAFLTSELREIARHAPALPSTVADQEPKDGNRKPLVDDCPICCMEFEEAEKVVWCQAACGNNIHEACFNQWARTKPSAVTCPFCRTPWQDTTAPKAQKVNLTDVAMPVQRNAHGYYNVRDQLDYS